MVEGVGDLQSRLSLLRVLMPDSESDGKCSCLGRGGRIHYSYDGVPDGEIPSDRCEDCGGQVIVFCVNYVSNWREF